MAGIGVNGWMLGRVMSYQKDDGWYWSERVDVDESCLMRTMMAGIGVNVWMLMSHVL